MLEARYDFSQVENELKGARPNSGSTLAKPIRKRKSWNLSAKSIRQRLHDGARYRDIRVLLGDVEAYQLQLKTILTSIRFPFTWDEVKLWSIIP